MSDKDEKRRPDENWRDTMHPPRLWSLNAYSLLALAPFFMKWAWVTFFIAIVGLFYFWIAQFKGYEPLEAIKALKCYFMGDHRPHLPPNRRRYYR